MTRVFYDGGDQVCEEDMVTLKRDREASGVIFETDAADGSAWVDFPYQRRQSDWFCVSELILVRRG